MIVNVFDVTMVQNTQWPIYYNKANLKIYCKLVKLLL
jgi:hypothetical protein